ncbi:17369_t:CDS:2, partial [Entrophospora sp. SA101]
LNFPDPTPDDEVETMYDYSRRLGPNKKRKHLERVEETRYNLRSRGPRKNYKDGPSNVHQKGKGESPQPAYHASSPDALPSPDE